MTDSYSKPDLSTEDLNLVCRACLSTSGVLKNMMEWGLVQDFYKLTNIMVSSIEGIPHSICMSCEEMLLRCSHFKKQCEQSDILLRDTVKKKKCLQNLQQESQENTVSFIMEENKLIITIVAPNTNEKIFFPCPHSCHDTFLKKTDLLNHLVKSHQRNQEFVIEQRFHCSITECSYHINSNKNKYFSNRKFLNQHVNKVHKEKNITCNLCNFKFSTNTDYNRHIKTCNYVYLCQICDKKYTTNDKLLVHLMRKHPDLHQQYKNERKREKKESESLIEVKKAKTEEKLLDYMCDSPKRSFATQTLEESIKNDVTLSWQPEIETKKDEISTQTVFEDLLSLKSQTSEDSIFCSETVSLSDIQTQTFPVEFGLIRSNKETITSETQSPDLSIKETQTCPCLYETRTNERVSPTSSASFSNCISTETQTLDLDEILRYCSAETQTSFDDLLAKDCL
ncbi:zinc finger protein 570-like [Colias croceus]|uniref:zinc finger protein 570-like n=1 Tax=Colias crocea TaxID=72248 RepID=UPI001E27E141|nr:zinc finger protein 570-like [Colias croceus]